MFGFLFYSESNEAVSIIRARALSSYALRKL